ncbi:hypothetical protein M2171_007338 [Bradyrhizobium japonicum USDA 38]|uniref:hypothetical protein n=1 Tax=Bradyrhizobium japonicum TaxID=375 RepID=UPI0012699BE7|nr:hypothetical protein [Bradyrhizobium japonicum]MCS3898205.1 hypothetical protein [Bradyrhizobium japonicum USDA 38]MCS3941258.1 hypothetical protein [Bradyrhizobium japonicum]MCW2216688.1 hypothetical protein [Bradyrhizobium japonicum]MCW2341304.1 hypothetical protein [Bradyrhizobium japonicum]
MKTTIIALCAAALIAAAPAALAQGVPGKALGLQHKISKRHHAGVTGYAPLHEPQTMGSKKGYPGAFGYAPDEPSRLDRNLEASRQAGGGGGGGGGSGM